MTSTTTPQVLPGKVAAQAANGFLSVRSGSAKVTCAVTAVIPGKGQQRPAGAVIAFYAKVADANKAVAEINGGNVPGWSQAAIVPAVPVYQIGGKADKESTKVALWLHAKAVHEWLAAKAAYEASRVTAPRGRGRKSA